MIVKPKRDREMGTKNREIKSVFIFEKTYLCLDHSEKVIDHDK